MKATFKNYQANGLATVPTRPNKAPYCKWADGVTDEWRYSHAHGIGIICGEISGGVECIDIDNKFGDAQDILNKYIDEIYDIWVKYDFVLESTVNGGFHIIYRCVETGRNVKLLKRHDVTLIETRGNGGYFCAAPTPGYNLINGDFDSIPHITAVEREEILSVAVNLPL